MAEQEPQTWRPAPVKTAPVPERDKESDEEKVFVCSGSYSTYLRKTAYFEKNRHVSYGSHNS